jgi:hypothetical protein
LGTLFKIAPQGRMTIIRQFSLADAVNDLSTPATFPKRDGDDVSDAGPKVVHPAHGSSTRLRKRFPW